MFRRGLKPAKFISIERRRGVRIWVGLIGGLVAAVCGAFIPSAWESDSDSTLALLVLGVALGIGVPLFVNERFANPSRGLDAKLQAFADHLPEAIDKIIRFMESDMTEPDATVLREDLAAAAARMVSGSHQGRICVWRLDRRDEREQANGHKYLSQDCARGRSERPRKDFQPTSAHGRGIIEATIDGVQIPVQNTAKPPKELPDIDVRDSNRYGCFILSPIRRGDVSWGAVTIDFDGKNHLTEIDGAMASAIARLFEIGFAVIKHGGEDLTMNERNVLRSELSGLADLKKKLGGGSNG